jgi:hypothetical protein
VAAHTQAHARSPLGHLWSRLNAGYIHACSDPGFRATRPGPTGSMQYPSSYLFRFQISESIFHFPPTFSQMTTYLPTISCGLSPLVLKYA